MEESERSIQPRFAPPLPTEPVTLARARQMVPNLLFDHLDLERRQSLSKSPFDRRTEPALARMSVHQDHQVIGEPGVFHIRPPLNTSDRLRSLQHRVHLVEVHVTEQRRNHPALRNALPTRRVHHHPSEPQHSAAAYSTRDLHESTALWHRIALP